MIKYHNYKFREEEFDLTKEGLKILFSYTYEDSNTTVSPPNIDRYLSFYILYKNEIYEAITDEKLEFLETESDVFERVGLGYELTKYNYDNELFIEYLVNSNHQLFKFNMIGYLKNELEFSINQANLIKKYSKLISRSKKLNNI